MIPNVQDFPEDLELIIPIILYVVLGALIPQDEKLSTTIVTMED